MTSVSNKKIYKNEFYNFFTKPEIVAKFYIQCKAQAEPSLFYKTCPIYFWRESQTHILAPGNSNGHPHPSHPTSHTTYTQRSLDQAGHMWVRVRTPILFNAACMKS